MNVGIGVTGKIFNLSEAQDLLPIIQKITEKHHDLLKPVQSRLNLMLSNDPRRQQLEREYQGIVSRWRTKVEKLGGVVSGLWVVGFDVGVGVGGGGGLLSWKYPELKISYFLEYNAAFKERVRLVNYIEETDPDWSH